MSADIARNLWSLSCSCLNSYCAFFIFLHFWFFFKYVAFCTGFNLLTPISLLSYIIMDLPIFVIAEWDTPLIDIRCLRGCSWLTIPIHFSGLTALMSADIARNLWSLVGSCLNSYSAFFIFQTFDFLFKYVAFCTGFNLLTPIFLLPDIIMDLPIFVIAEWATLLVDIRCPQGGS